MRKVLELKLLRSIKTGKGLIKLIISLRLIRRREKVKDVKRLSLTKKQRELVLFKTDAHCHICGIELEINDFHADHVKPHSAGGMHAENNYLASCATCNKLRWHYSPEEIQVILKLGVWAKTKVLDESEMGLKMANEFVKHELGLRKKRKKKLN